MHASLQQLRWQHARTTSASCSSSPRSTARTCPAAAAAAGGIAAQADDASVLVCFPPANSKPRLHDTAERARRARCGPAAWHAGACLCAGASKLLAAVPCCLHAPLLREAGLWPLGACWHLQHCVAGTAPGSSKHRVSHRCGRRLPQLWQADAPGTRQSAPLSTPSSSPASSRYAGGCGCCWAGGGGGCCSCAAARLLPGMELSALWGCWRG